MNREDRNALVVAVAALAVLAVALLIVAATAGPARGGYHQVRAATGGVSW